MIDEIKKRCIMIITVDQCGKMKTKLIGEKKASYKTHLLKSEIF